jgi:hypothetical protein
VTGGRPLRGPATIYVTGRYKNTTHRMTSQGRLGTLDLLWAASADERNRMLDALQEADRLQWLQDQEDEEVQSW